MHHTVIGLNQSWWLIYGNIRLVSNDSFWCQPEWVTIHTVSVTAMFGVVAGVQFAPEFGKEKYFWLRVSLIVAWEAIQ